jgi:hypothetical protein
MTRVPAWPEMALFVMEMAVNSAVRHVKQKTQEKLEQRVTKLKSTKGKLLNFIKHQSEQLAEFQSQARVRAAKRAAAHQKEMNALRENFVDLEKVRPSKSAIRSAVLHEMVFLAQCEGRRHYPDIIYYWAVVILFRSRSCYEYVHEFFPSPVASAVYYHFAAKLRASAARLKSLDQIEPYLTSRVADDPSIAQGAVFAVLMKDNNLTDCFGFLFEDGLARGYALDLIPQPFEEGGWPSAFHRRPVCPTFRSSRTTVLRRRASVWRHWLGSGGIRRCARASSTAAACSTWRRLGSARSVSF